MYLELSAGTDPGSWGGGGGGGGQEGGGGGAREGTGGGCVPSRNS